MDEVVAQSSASHLISLINQQMMPQAPASFPDSNHLKLAMNDIETPLSGYISPSIDHIDKLLRFVKDWERTRPLVVHCWAGVSRSTAAAFITLCALNPQVSEEEIAQNLRDKSPTATPNKRLVSCADQVLGRSRRMILAIEGIGRGDVNQKAVPFSLPSDQGSKDI